ncbi:MAG: CRTAC1 family protein [Congregibacter sp.]
MRIQHTVKLMAVGFIGAKPGVVTLSLLLSAGVSAQIAMTPVQPELFKDPQGQSNAWGDYDGDGDLDLVVLFRDAPVRLYENQEGVFVDVAPDSGLPIDGGNPRSVAWGDYDKDGDLDLYIGYSGFDGPRNRLMQNRSSEGKAGFVDVAPQAGVDIQSITRQVSFIDFDADGDLDLYVALRSGANRLFKNAGGGFEDVTFKIGIAEPRRTVGACWFDMDQDGDLDLFTANQNGDRDGVFRNDGERFTEIGMEMNMDQPRRPLADGSVDCAVADYDNDGDLDLYVAEYGDDSLFRNNGDGSFTDIADKVGLAVHAHIVTGVWGDVQHDGFLDLYTVGYINGKPGAADYLFVNRDGQFVNQLPDVVARHDSDHGVQWADFDGDGDLDLALAANDPAGSHYLFRNQLPADVASRSLQVLVLDQDGHYTRAGSEVRIYAAGTRELIATRLVDTASGYNAQNAKPVHFGLPKAIDVDVEVTLMSPTGRQTRMFTNVDWRALSGSPFIVRVGAE